MKQILIILLAIAVALFAGSCSKENSKSTQMLQPQKLIVFKADGANVSAYELNIDLNKHSLSLNTEAIYEIADSSRLENSRIFPQYMSSSTLILRETPVNSIYNSVPISNDNHTLYFEEYTLQFDNNNFSFQIYKSGKSICDKTSLVHDGEKLMPTSFFIDKDGKVAILCMTSASLIDTEMVSMLYTKNGESITLDKFIEYPKIWDDFGLSKIQCPNYLSDYTNVTVDPKEGRFLYNETTKLMTISPYDGNVKCILDENAIKVNLPYLDTHRESYSFFRDFVYQDNCYVATFPDLNSSAGTYAVFYSHTGEYIGCVRCGNDNITLFDKKNAELDKITALFIPLIYIPSILSK